MHFELSRDVAKLKTFYDENDELFLLPSYGKILDTLYHDF
jgi:hypothetical protein